MVRVGSGSYLLAASGGHGEIRHKGLQRLQEVFRLDLLVVGLVASSHHHYHENHPQIQITRLPIQNVDDDRQQCSGQQQDHEQIRELQEEQ